jgi:uncharacterized membrane protein YkvA (DUF1232 family)
MRSFFLEIKNFLLTTYEDKRIPERDKKIFLSLLALMFIRILFIPDWIPYIGPLDVLIMAGILGEFVSEVLDQNLLLSHYPWGMKSFARIKRIARFFAFFSPTFLTDHLWQYTKDPF